MDVVTQPKNLLRQTHEMKHLEMTRRSFVKSAAAGSALAVFPQILLGLNTDLKWHDLTQWGVEGRGWNDTERFFDRLPARAQSTVSEAVWNLSRHSAGMSVRFVTDASTIRIRYSLLSDRLALPHMPATGVSGVDLYAQDEAGVDRWIAGVYPSEQHIEVELTKDLPQKSRTYTLYLPLYNGVDAMKLGVDPNASIEVIAPRDEPPILFFGTSIMQGACASRPGMAIPAILGRRLGKPTINLGFSGNGQMQPEVGTFLAELDPSVFVIDCLPNMTDSMISERTVPLVQQLKAKHSNTSIILVEGRMFSNAPFYPEKEKNHHRNRAALRNSFKTLIDTGVTGIYYLRGDGLLGDDAEATVDGSHPNDLGMVRYADAYEPMLRRVLRISN